MWQYWLIFLIPAFGVLLGRRVEPRLQRIIWGIVVVLYALIIGMRYQVGGDWYTYLEQFAHVAPMGWDGAFDFSDPGYYILGWLVAQAGGDIYMANLLCGFLVMLGVVTFARKQPDPWLALLVAVPYLIIVVAMGYTRQSVALGFVMIGLAALSEQRLLKFVFWVMVGALFHKTAVLLLPIAGLAASRRRLWTLVWVGLLAAVGARELLLQSSDHLWHTYVQDQMRSYGGPIRVVLNAIPAVLLLSYRRRLRLQPDESRLWIWMSVFALGCVALVPLASTAVDRMALYFIPIQMFVFSRLPRLAVRVRGRTLIVAAVVFYYATIQFVWLNYAVHAKYWVPYHFMPMS